jgi:hypothetical protein
VTTTPRNPSSRAGLGRNRLFPVAQRVIDLSSDRSGPGVHRLRHLIERVRSVNARSHRIGLDEVGQPILQVASTLLGNTHGQPLPHEPGPDQGPELTLETTGHIPDRRRR